jgi:prepilin-type N-terminal cleavage/methylation domain-containing protein
MLTRLRHEQAGFTLVELLVVMVLMGVVGSITVAAIVTGMNSQRTTQDRLDALHELEVATQRAIRDLRVASPLLVSTQTPASEHIGTRFRRGGEPTTVFYELETDEDSNEQFLVQLVSTGGESFSRRLVTAVDNGDTPLFRYFDTDGSELECDWDLPELEYRDCILSANAVAIRLVRGVHGQEPVVVETRVNIRSIRYGSDS